MRRGKICIALGVFILGTALICNSNRSEVYEKKMYFNSPEEVIEVLNNNPIATSQTIYYGDKVYSDKFLECLSYRKRVSGSNLYISKYDLKINNEVSEDFKNGVIEKYKNMAGRLLDYNIGDDIQAYNLVGTSVDFNNKENNENVNVIFINEGDGWVIDSILTNNDDGHGNHNDRS